MEMKASEGKGAEGQRQVVPSLSGCMHDYESLSVTLVQPGGRASALWVRRGSRQRGRNG